MRHAKLVRASRGTSFPLYKNRPKTPKNHAKNPKNPAACALRARILLLFSARFARGRLRLRTFLRKVRFALRAKFRASREIAVQRRVCALRARALRALRARFQRVFAAAKREIFAARKFPHFFLRFAKKKVAKTGCLSGVRASRGAKKLRFFAKLPLLALFARFARAKIP